MKSQGVKGESGKNEGDGKKNLSWEQFCGEHGVRGEKIVMATLADDEIRRKPGIPEGLILKMIEAAGKLSLQKPPKTRCGGVPDGISFHVACYMGSNKPESIVNNFVRTKRGASECYENTLFSSTILGEILKNEFPLVVHQNLAPCLRCRAGYCNLAKTEPHRTIAVYADKGYDGVPDNTVFVFTPTGSCFWG
ncbi:TPA: hypothetical protein ACU9K7_003258 [Salmonella enterica]